MAKLRTPLLSFGATGKIGKTLVLFAWKGIDVAREYVVPSNPNTAAQQTQRGYFSDAVAAWRNYFTNAVGRAAWDRLASAGKKAQSGFNAAMKALIGMASTDPNASFGNAGVATAGNLVTVSMLNMDDGGVGDEAGNFEVWVGDSPTSLLKFEDVAIAAGDIVTADLGDTDDVKYVGLRKDSFNRSGIYKITLIA